MRAEDVVYWQASRSRCHGIEVEPEGFEHGPESNFQLRDTCIFEYS